MKVEIYKIVEISEIVEIYEIVEIVEIVEIYEIVEISAIVDIFEKRQTCKQRDKGKISIFISE